ncbi:MAG: hypothetical protein ACK5Y3_02590 [Pseudanabaena sp.]
MKLVVAPAAADTSGQAVPADAAQATPTPAVTNVFMLTVAAVLAYLPP